MPDNLISIYKHELEKLNKGRKIWIFLSSLMFFVIGFVAFEWDLFEQLGDHSKWIFVSVSGIVFCGWWYWTINIIKKIMAYQYGIIEILTDITNDIQTVRIEVTELHNHN